MDDMDLSSFMCILIMSIGCLIVILIVNVIIIISNPENVEIVSLIRGAFEEYEDDSGVGASIGVPVYGNESKDPYYIDVHNNRVIIYPEKDVVTLKQLESGENAFEDLLNKVEPMKEDKYIILVLRPRSSRVGKQIRRVIRDRGIDVGQELFEAGRKIPEIKSVQTASEE